MGINAIENNATTKDVAGSSPNILATAEFPLAGGAASDTAMANDNSSLSLRTNAIVPNTQGATTIINSGKTTDSLTFLATAINASLSTLNSVPNIKMKTKNGIAGFSKFDTPGNISPNMHPDANTAGP